MGCRLHSAKKYEVEWGSNSVFNWGQNHINPIINCLAEGDFWCDSMDYIEGATILKANRDNLIKNVDCIITPNKDWEEQETLDELIEDMENDKYCDITREYLHTKLKHLIDEADSRDTYIHFSWF